jgi:hypothetical protein
MAPRRSQGVAPTATAFPPARRCGPGRAQRGTE